MVDKIDRPDPINKYEILPSKETHDEGQRKQDERRDEDEFSTPGHEISWRKYRIGTPERQTVTMQQSDVRQAIFRQTTLQSRTAILEMDLIMKDGRTLPRAQLVSSNMDDYWKWKGWVPGQVLPIELMNQGPLLKVSIQTLSAPSRTVGEVTGTNRTQTRAPEIVQPKRDWLRIIKISAGVIVALWVVGKAVRWW